MKAHHPTTTDPDFRSASRHRERWHSLLAIFSAFIVVTSAAFAGAVRPGFNSNSLPANDDGSTGRVTVGFTMNFFGAQYSQLYVNNNGNLSFDGPLSAYTPSPIAASGLKIIAPFWADVDTRGTGSGVVTYSFGTGVVEGRNAFGANYLNVGYYNRKADKKNSFQVVLIDRSDIGAGDFDIEYNYNTVQWETGDASGGSGGVGGQSVRVGYASGTGATLELGGSGANGAFLDSNLATGLVYNSLNSSTPGRYLFEVRNGGIVNAPPVANAGADVISAPGAPVSLDGSGSYDPENSPLTFFWTQESGTGVTIVNPTSATPSFTGPAGTYTFRLTVSDGARSSFDFVTVNIGIPVATVRPATGITHNRAILHGTVNPAGVATNYHFEYGPAGGTLLSTPVLNLPASVGEVSIDATVLGLAPTTNYVFRLLANNANGSGTSLTESFTTSTSPVVPPTVSITSPANGAAFIVGTIINIEATASDSDGTIVKVEFFDGAVKIGEDVSAPYTQTVNGLAVGDHQLIAVARDNSGATTQSAPVTITINNIPNAHPPVAVNDGPLELPLSHFNAAGNDSDADGDIVFITAVGAAAGGTAVLEADGTVSYTAGAAFTGTDSFTYTLSDGRGLFATGTVSVRDTTAPVITYNPALLSVTTGANPTAPIPDVASLVIATDNVGVLSKTQSIASGTQESPGSYTVVVTVADAAGNSALCDVIVTITDDSAPVITFTPGPQIANTGNNPRAPLPDVAALVTATDNVAVISKTQTPLAGTLLPPGIYTVVVTVSDADAHIAQTTVQVTVVDDYAPTIVSSPAPFTIVTDDNATAALPDVAKDVVAIDNVGVVSKTQSPAADTLRAPGVYEIIVTVSDAAGLATQVSVFVTVADNVAPVFTKAPSARSIRAATDQTSLALPDITSEAVATDNVGVAAITQSPAPGTILEMGSYIIVVTAHDAAGNTASANVDVTILRGNRTPVANYDSAFAMSRTLTLNVIANDTDDDGDVLSVLSFTQPQHGRVTRSGNGNSLRFDPDLAVGDIGEIFTYTITDGFATSTATVEIAPIPEGRRFSGVIEDNVGPVGLVVIAFTKPGFFTGYVNLANVRHVFTGGMSTQGFGIGTIKVTATTFGGVTVRPGGYTPTGERRLLLGFTGVPGLPSNEFFSEQSPYWANVATPLAGQFAVALKKAPTDPGPHASGFVIIKLAANGASVHLGRSPNGQVFSSSGQLLSGGRLGIHGTLGAPSPKRGFIAGMLQIDNTGNFLTGSVRWKLPPLRDTRFPAGIDTTLSPIGDRYNKATTAQGAFGSVVPVTKTLRFTEGLFLTPVLANATFGTPTRSEFFDAPITYIAVVPSNGKITGFAKPTGPNGLRVPFDGIILPLRGEIYGSMRNTTTISAISSQ